MQKKFLASAAAIVVSIVIAASIFAFVPKSNDVLVNGILVSPEGGTVIDAVEQLRSQPSFITSPVLHEPVESIDHQMYNGSVLFLQVLSGNKRQWVQLMRVYDAEGNWLKCVKGNLDMPDDVEVSVEDCEAELAGRENVAVLIELPDEGLAYPTVELSRNQVKIRPNSDDSIGQASFLALQLLFENSREILQRSNVLISGITA